MHRVARQRLVLMRSRVHRIVDRVAIDAVGDGDVTAHVANPGVFAVGNVTRHVVEVIAIAARPRSSHAGRIGRGDALGIRGGRRSLQVHVLASASRNEHGELRDIAGMIHRIGSDLLPLLEITDVETTECRASGLGSVETNLAAVAERARLWRRKTCNDELTQTPAAGAARAGAARRHHNAAVGIAVFRAVTHFAEARLDDVIAAIGLFAIVAIVRLNAVAVVAFFTHVDRAIATNTRLAGHGHAHPAGAAAGAGHAAAAARHTAIAHIKGAVCLAGLHAHPARFAYTCLRRIGNARAAAPIRIAAARLECQCG